MAKKTYIITYIAYDVNNQVIKQGKIKVKNKETELSAKISLEKYLEKKLNNFKRLYISECKIDININNAFNIFNDFFGTNI